MNSSLQDGAENAMSIRIGAAGAGAHMPRQCSASASRCSWRRQAHQYAMALALEPMPIAAAGARILGADGRPGDKLAATVTRRRPSHMVVGRVKILAEYVPQGAVGDARARTGELRKGRFGGAAKIGTIANVERAAKAGD